MHLLVLVVVVRQGRVGYNVGMLLCMRGNGMESSQVTTGKDEYLAD